ncbi:thiosulfate sulfurtransferase 18-like [Miscanthus floridulus]|uniref:thiosulfate sulfurtransferase 18-like n=1 Tax=Miscanthus floridulus TaxID=154761 RepID=UPI003459811E
MFITQGSRVKNAQSVEQVASLLTSKEEAVLVGCQSGKRSELACIDLQAAGFKKVKNMGGGYLAWVHHGFPVPGDMEHDASPRPPTPPPAPSSQA